MEVAAVGGRSMQVIAAHGRVGGTFLLQQFFNRYVFFQHPLDI